MVRFRSCLLAALLIATTTSLAVASTGLVRTSATMRAGPGSGFPVVERIPAGARVTIHGCIEGGAWCDVSFARERGWVAARTLAYLYRERYVELPEYVEYVPVAPFVLSTYWSSFYIGRPWFYRHAFWNRYWQRHPPVMAQNPQQPGMTAAGAGRGPGAVAQPASASSAAAGAGGQPVTPPRMATGSPAPVAGPGGARTAMGAASQPATPAQNTQSVMGRGGGSPQSARAQMGGMRGTIGGAPQIGTPAHFAGGPAMSAPHMGASGPRGGGGGRSGSGGGFRRH